MAKTITPIDWNEVDHYLAIVPHGWGRGVDEKQALRRARSNGVSGDKRALLYAVKAGAESGVSDFDGSVSYAKEGDVVKVAWYDKHGKRRVWTPDSVIE